MNQRLHLATSEAGLEGRTSRTKPAVASPVPFKETRRDVREALEALPKVDFSKCQMDQIVQAHDQGRRVEVESFSPYLADYDTFRGEIWPDRLIPADNVGLEVLRTLHRTLPKATIVSLYDEYNSGMTDSSDFWGRPTFYGTQLEFSEDARHEFPASIERLLRQKGILKPTDKSGREFLLISESSKVHDAEELVRRLQASRFIEEAADGSIYFVNPNAEDAGYSRILLRNKTRWMCEALDASTYLKPENLEITHLVVLPNSFRPQQDKVWEILRVLGIKPTNYHNIFFDESVSPQEAATTIRDEIGKWRK